MKSPEDRQLMRSLVMVLIIVLACFFGVVFSFLGLVVLGFLLEASWTP